jgi:hypothetical protein
VSEQRRLNFRDLDSVAPDLDLKVFPPDVLQKAAGQHPA